MNVTTRALVETMATLNAKDHPSVVDGFWLKSVSGDSTFVKWATFDGTMIYARSDRGLAHLMMPIDQLAAVEFEFKKGPLVDGKTLPEIIKAVGEIKKKAA
jgi:hypothetical protein